MRRFLAPMVPFPPPFGPLSTSSYTHRTHLRSIFRFAGTRLADTVIIKHLARLTVYFAILESQLETKRFGHKVTPVTARTKKRLKMP